MDGSTFVVLLVLGFFVFIFSGNVSPVSALIGVVVWLVIMLVIFTEGETMNKQQSQENIDDKPWSDEAKRIAKDILDENERNSL